MKKILAAALVLGLVLPTASHAASTKKPAVKTAVGKEGTATHETSEAATGTAEESTKKVAKSKTSVIKKSTTKAKAKK